MPGQSDVMLLRLLGAAERALHATDPADRADLIARLIQPYSGWALRWAVEDCRAAGLSWETIAGIVERPYPTLLRQFQAGGPLYSVRPAHSSTTQNFDAQSPLRRVATDLAHAMMALAVHDPEAVTNLYLGNRVDRLSTAQTVGIGTPLLDLRPLLKATQVVLAAANGIKSQIPSRDAMSELEREVWTILDQLKACYQRDHQEMETAYHVMSEIRQQSDSTVRLPGQ